MQNRYFAYFSDVSHIGVDFRILICKFAYAWRPWNAKGIMVPSFGPVCISTKQEVPLASYPVSLVERLGTYHIIA